MITRLEVVKAIEVEGFIAERPGAWGGKDWPTVLASDLVEQIRAAQVDGVRALVLSIRSPGGHVAGTFDVVRAIQAFQASGGVVVAYVKDARSSAPALALVADLCIIDPAGSFILHSMIGNPADIARANAAIGDLFEARTATPRADLELWLSLSDNTDPAVPSFAEMDAATALSQGWADAPGDLESARRVAEALASGRKVPSLRQTALAAKAVPVLPALAPQIWGVKLDHTGTALKVAAANLQLGTKVLSDLWFTGVSPYFGRVTWSGTSVVWSGFGSVGSGSISGNDIVLPINLPAGWSSGTAYFSVFATLDALNSSGIAYVKVYMSTLNVHIQIFNSSNTQLNPVGVPGTTMLAVLASDSGKLVF